MKSAAILPRQHNAKPAANSHRSPLSSHHCIAPSCPYIIRTPHTATQPSTAPQPDTAPRRFLVTAAAHPERHTLKAGAGGLLLFSFFSGGLKIHKQKEITREYHGRAVVEWYACRRGEPMDLRSNLNKIYGFLKSSPRGGRRPTRCSDLHTTLILAIWVKGSTGGEHGPSRELHHGSH